MFSCFHLLEVFSRLFNTKLLSMPLLGDSRHLSYEVLPTYSAQVTGLTEGLGLPRMQTKHEMACGTKRCQGKVKQKTRRLSKAGWPCVTFLAMICLYTRRAANNYHLLPLCLSLERIWLSLFPEYCFRPEWSCKCRVSPPHQWWRNRFATSEWN